MTRPIVTFVTVAALTAAVGAETVTIEAPVLDRWNYPFNQTPGSKSVAKIFGALTSEGFVPEFDNRDGQMLVGFDLTDVELPCGASMTSARVTVQVESDQTFGYDPTLDPWSSYLIEDDPAHTPDPDTGRPIELFGVGYRNGWTAQTYPENGPFCDGCNCFLDCQSVRNTYPTDLDGGEARDISNNVDEQFDPTPFAIGQNDTLSQGELVPTLTVLTFEIDLANPDVRAYLEAALADDILMLMVASIFPAEQKVGGTFPEIMTKENLLVQIGVADPAQLELTIESSAPGDTDGNGIVDTVDLLIMLGAWGECPASPPCPADFNCDGTVDVVDLLVMLGGWTFP